MSGYVFISTGAALCGATSLCDVRYEMQRLVVEIDQVYCRGELSLSALLPLESRHLEWTLPSACSCISTCIGCGKQEISWEKG